MKFLKSIFLRLLKSSGPQEASWRSDPQGGWVQLAIAGASALASAYQANKANQIAKRAGQAGQVDIAALDERARAIAQRNAQESAALEQSMTPEVPRLRSAANQGLLDSLGPNAGEEASIAALMGSGDPGNKMQTPLLRAAIAKARADLGLGGQLSPEIQNFVTRRALEGAGTTTPGQLNLGRDLSARDLGLTSMDLENRRLDNAGRFGQLEMGLEQEDNNVNFNNTSNFLNKIQLLRAIQGDRFGRNLSTAQYGESIARPIVGMDPGSVVDLTVGNSNNRQAALANQANVRGQQSQNYANMAGQAAGYGLLAYNNRRPGVGQPTTYDAFKKNNPYSGAALGG